MRTHPVLKRKRFHHGIDLAGTWQEEVQAPAPGTVIFAGRKGSFGKVVQVRHAYGVVTTYAHLAKITVRRGADVVTGSVVGKMGRTGRGDGAHRHYEIRIGTNAGSETVLRDRPQDWRRRRTDDGDRAALNTKNTRVEID